jgi:hypothetical protein
LYAPVVRKFRAAGVVAAVLASGCGGLFDELGYRNRVLHRAASPVDASIVAVCQEVPMFDGPNYDIRLERPDGTKIRGLYGIGDGDPCTEMAWGPDGKTLTVMSNHVARVRFVDVDWALRHLSDEMHYWDTREVSYSSEREWKVSRHLRYVDAQTVAFDVCPVGREKGIVGDRPCLQPAVTIKQPVRLHAP